MLKLLFGVALVAGLVLAAALVPIRGATVLERWASAPTTRTFLERSWREAKVAAGLEKERPRAQRSAAARPRPAQKTARAAPPAEQHTDADRAALDRIVADHAN